MIVTMRLTKNFKKRCTLQDLITYGFKYFCVSLHSFKIIFLLYLHLPYQKELKKKTRYFTVLFVLKNLFDNFYPISLVNSPFCKIEKKVHINTTNETKFQNILKVVPVALFLQNTL